MKILIFLIVFFSLTSSYSQNIFGAWEVYRFKPGEISAITDKEAKAYVGRKIFLESNYVKAFGDTCKHALYNARKAKANEFLYYNYRTSARTLGITSENVDVIEVHCGKVRKIPEHAFLLTEEKDLIISKDGYFFWLKKIH